MNIPDSFKMYRSKDGQYTGYFQEGAEPPEFLLSTSRFVSSSEFNQYLSKQSGRFEEILDRTVEYFENEVFPDYDVVFEPLEMDAELCFRYVKDALENDYLSSVVEVQGYSEWEYINSVRDVLLLNESLDVQSKEINVFLLFYGLPCYEELIQKCPQDALEGFDLSFFNGLIGNKQE